MDLFGTTGQQRRQWLDRQGNALGEAMRYYLGPSGVDKRLNALASVAPYAMDGMDYIDAQEGARNLFAEPSLANALAFTAPMVALAVPGISNRLAQGMTDVAGDAAQFVTDESGALRLFHGSPHDFDKFSMDKIGTGEGAQAYGHGLYFAEREGVARGYRDALTDQPNILRLKGGDVAAAIEQTKKNISNLRDRVAESEARASTPSGRSTLMGWQKQLADNEATLAELESGKVFGRMYEVNVNANPEDFLDWDKPLSEQGAKVQDVLRSFGAKPDDVGAGAYSRAGIRRFAIMGPDGRWGPGGATFEESLAKAGGDAAKVRQTLDPSAPNRSEGLRQAGIPGIRYLDAGSRGAGDGSRNYVVFDENLIEIVRKYGIAGAATVLGVSQADIAQAMGVDAMTGQPMAATPPRGE